MSEIEPRGMLMISVFVRTGVSEVGVIDMQTPRLFVVVRRFMHMCQAPQGAERCA